MTHNIITVFNLIGFFVKKCLEKIWGSAEEIAKKIQADIIGTSMLPIEIMQERSKDSNQGIDLSGLSFGRHKFPFNVLVLKETF